MIFTISCTRWDPAQQESLFDVNSQEQLIVYTSHKEEVYLPIIREFEERTGIWVEVHTGGTAEIFSEIEENAEKGICDIVFGGGIESYEADKDALSPYVTSEKEALIPEYCSDEGYWTPFTSLPIVFVYNNRLLSEDRVPAGWKELLYDDEWKGQIAFADPLNSGTSYTILSAFIQLFGEGDAPEEEVISRFAGQLDGRLLSSSGDILPEVSDGDYLVGITLEETALKYMATGSDISMYYPAEGTCVVPDGCAVVKNAPHGYNAGLFIDFIAGKDVQNFAMENFRRRSVRTDLDEGVFFEGIESIDLDIYRAGKDEDRVLSLWSRLMGSKEEEEP